MKTFPNYDDWRKAITLRCGLTLSRDYCTERIAALRDDMIPSTASALALAGMVVWQLRPQSSHEVASANSLPGLPQTTSSS